LIDTMLDRATEIASGDPRTPEQATEVWTFVRRTGGARRLEIIAIQQA